jgi:D-alanyl-D-alanine carboxypeptidase
MKSATALVIITLLTFLSYHQAKGQNASKPFQQNFKTNHSKSHTIQAIIDEYTRKGVPGIAVAIKDKEGVWEGVSGYAQLESKQPLTRGFIHAGGSVTKTYIGAAFLLMKEQQKINLDAPIVQSLPDQITSKIEKAKCITVRMLLNHTSGIRDYISDSAFLSNWEANPTKQWTADEALTYIYDRPLLFAPGSSFTYSNTNYILLSYIIENLTKRKEGTFLQEALFKKAGLKYTFYKTQPQYLEGLPMPDYYFDRGNTGELQNVTLPTKVEINGELGDGGLVATPIDFVLFMDALMKGRIVSSSSISEMKQYGPASEYGLGLQTGFNYSNKVQHGHMGAVVGGASLLLYFEEQGTSLFIASNVDANLFESKTRHLYHEMKNKICEYIAAH